MRKKVLPLLLTAIVFSVAGKAEAGDKGFQFAPPPFAILNLRSVDVKTDTSWDYIGMKMGDFKFNVLNYGTGRAVKKWDSGGFSLGTNVQLILGTGKFDMGNGDNSSFTLGGMGLGIQPNWYFDLKGNEEDDFSLPFYFGPHLTGSVTSGSLSFKTQWLSYYDATYIPYYGYIYTPHYVEVTDTMRMTTSVLMYGWQAGIQAGINLGEYFKFVPYVDFSQELGGTTKTTISAIYTEAMNSTTSTSIKSTPIATQPGFDFQLRKIALSLGGAIKNSKSGGQDGTKIKTTVFHIRFQHKFRSICGI